MYFVYVLLCQKDGRLYKGTTNSLEQRVARHNAGLNKSTKGFIPWVLVYHETFTERTKARDREKYFKTGAGREFLRKTLGL